MARNFLPSPFRCWIARSVGYFFFAAVLASRVFALDASRQITQYGHDSWNYQNGLPGGAVYSVVQLPDGYIWLRQASDLLRFDGVRFVSVVPQVNGEPVSESLRAMSKNADGSLILRGVTRTLRLKDGKFFDAAPGAHLPDGMERVVFQSSDGTIWIGSDSNVFRFADGKLEEVAIGTGWVSALCETKDHSVWIGAASGLYRYRDGKLTLYSTGFNLGVGRTAVPLTVITTGVRLLASVTALLEDKKGVLWVGTQSGVYKLIDGNLVQDDQTQILAGKSISACVEDRHGNLWVGTDGAGLYRLTGSAWSRMTAEDGLGDNNICAIEEDGEGSLWIGTRSGLERLRDTAFATIGSREGLSHDNAAVVAVGDDSTLFVYTSGGGITQIRNGVYTAVTAAQGLTSNYAGTLFVDHQGTLWIGTDRGLSSYRDGVVNNYPDQGALANCYISAINEDEDGLILASSNMQLYRFKDGQFTPYQIKVPVNAGTKSARYVYSMQRDAEGTLWIGMTAGLYRVPKGVAPEDAHCSSYDLPVHAFEDDGRGFIWIAGPEVHGFTRLRKEDGQLINFGPEAGIPTSEIGHILSDRNGNLWLGTRAGILRILREELDDFAAGKIKRVNPFTYGIIDGMRTEEVSTQQPSACRGRDGRLYFGSRKGLVVVDPERLPRNTRVPPVVVEEFVVDKTTEMARDHLELEPGSESLEIHYTALSLLAPSRVRFKYRLSGYHEGWIDAGARRTAYFTHLPPGSYTFQVIAANDDGVWNNTGASLRFTLRPHFYQTTWFYLSCVLGLALSGHGMHRLRTRRLRQRQVELEALVAERTRNLQDEVTEKTRTQQELQKYREYLEQLVAQRTAALQKSNEQLQREIAERRSGEAALRMSEDRYRRFFEEDLAGAFIASPDARLVACNPSFVRLFGFASAAVAEGVPLSELFEKAGDAAEALERVRRDGKVQDCELQMRRRDGRIVHVLANIIGAFGGNNQLSEIKGYVVDMTDRKRLENQLRQSQKMEAVGQLAGGIAHDFNNLLTAIIGSSECILDLGPGESDTVMLATEIRDAGKRAAALTRQLLAFSRKQVLQPKVLSLNETVVETERMLRRLIGEDIILEQRLSPKLNYIRADPNQVQQILMNLTVNARDAMPRGGNLRIETENVTLDEPLVQGAHAVPPGNYVCLRVVDSGTGMTPEVQAHVFEPFFTTKGVGKGTGLGLSTVYGIVQQSNGFITFTSVPGQGTQFSIFFPVVDRPKTAERSSNTAPPIEAGKETILLVEDNELVLRVAQRTLQQVGFRVYEATCGDDALQRLKAHQGKIDLLLTDLVMPGMNGRELAEKIVADHPSIRVLFMSGYTEDALVRVGGVDNVSFLEKPFTADALIRRVRQVLDQSAPNGKKPGVVKA